MHQKITFCSPLLLSITTIQGGGSHLFCRNFSMICNNAAKLITTVANGPVCLGQLNSNVQDQRNILNSYIFLSPLICRTPLVYIATVKQTLKHSSKSGKFSITGAWICNPKYSKTAVLQTVCFGNHPSD